MSIEIITKPKVNIDQSILDEIEAKYQEEGQVIFHCLYTNRYPFESAIRIWNTTYLVDHHSDHKSGLVLAENIVMAPEWQIVHPLTSIQFSLIFSKLPKSCTLFDFVEDCKSETGAFIFKDIPRRKSDIYYARIK